MERSKIVVGRARPASVLAFVVTVMSLAAPFAEGRPQAPAPAMVDVEVSDSSGGRVTDAIVELGPVGAPLHRLSWVDDGAAYRATAVAAGRHVVHVMRLGFAVASREVMVTPGAHLRVSVVLEPATVVEAVRVEGVSPSAAVTATRLVTAPLDTPRSVTVIGAERLKTQNIRTVSEALAYVPGMSVNSYRTGSYHFYSRGYRMGPDDTRVDGLVGVNAGGRYGGSMFGVEDVVFLRGPAGILYGSSATPGGLVNLVSKQPQAAPVTTVDVRFSGYAGGGVGLADRTSAGLDLDTTGPWGKGRRVMYRGLATAEHMEYFTGGVDDRNQYAAGLLRLALDPHGAHTVTPTIKWTRFDRPQGGGLLVSPSTSLSTSDGVRGPINRGDLSPMSVNHASGGGIDEVLQAGADARGAIGGRTRYTAAYRFLANDTAIDQFTPQVNVALLQSSGLIPRGQTRSETERRYHNYDAQVVQDIVRGSSWSTLVQAGVTGRRSSTRGTAAQGPLPGPQSPVDIYTGLATSPLVDRYPAIAFQPWTDATYWTTYLQNQTALAGGRVLVTLGVGYGENRLAVDQTARRSDLMPNGAIVVKPTDATSLYASYATSYNPSDPAAETASGRRGAFAPTQGVNAEVGIKGGRRRASWTVAAFHNAIDNALVQSGANDLNPNGNRYYAAAGTRQSRGVEASAELEPLPLLHVSGSVTYLDATYTGEGPATATLAIPGSRAEKSPMWAWNLWTRYARTAGVLDGLGAGLGIVHQGVRLGSNGARTVAAPDPLDLPAFTRVDASLSSRLGSRTEIGLHIENLFDALIFVNASVGSSIEVAAPRAIALRAGYRF